MVDLPTSIQPNSIQPLGMPVLAAPLAGLHSVPQMGPQMGPQVGLQTGPASRGQMGAQLENTRLRAETERFEAAFLAEMLRHSGLGKMPESFNGGAGEAAFAGTLVQEYANRIAATGTLGIAERIYQSLAERGIK